MALDYFFLSFYLVKPIRYLPLTIVSLYLFLTLYPNHLVYIGHSLNAVYLLFCVYALLFSVSLSKTIFVLQVS